MVRIIVSATLNIITIVTTVVLIYFHYYFDCYYYYCYINSSRSSCHDKYSSLVLCYYSPFPPLFEDLGLKTLHAAGIHLHIIVTNLFHVLQVYAYCR
jgi:hypothetical protein